MVWCGKGEGEGEVFVGRKKGRACTRPSAGSGSESLDGGGGIGLVENLAGISVGNFEGAEHLARRKEPVDTELNLGIPMAQHGEPIDAEFIAADGIDFPLGLFVPQAQDHPKRRVDLEHHRRVGPRSVLVESGHNRVEVLVDRLLGDLGRAAADPTEEVAGGISVLHPPVGVK